MYFKSTFLSPRTIENNVLIISNFQTNTTDYPTYTMQTIPIDTYNELRKENMLIHELSKHSERENRMLRGELEKLRGTLAVHQRRRPQASTSTQTYGGVSEQKAARQQQNAVAEELTLLREQASLDHVALRTAHTEFNTASHQKDLFERKYHTLVEEFAEMQRELIATRALLETEVNRGLRNTAAIQDLESQLQSTESDKHQLQHQDWRGFWEQKSAIDTKRSTLRVSSVTAAIAVVCVMQLQIKPKKKTDAEVEAELERKMSLLSKTYPIAVDAMSPVVVTSASASAAAAAADVKLMHTSPLLRHEVDRHAEPAAFMTVKQRRRKQRTAEDGGDSGTPAASPALELQPSRSFALSPLKNV